MIKKYSLSNFKAFKKLDDLEIEPLTILVGKNSCGKSSILHSLLLLKQSLDNSDNEKPLTIDGKYLRYSNLSEMTFGQPEIDKSEISFCFKIDNDDDNKSLTFSFNSIKNLDHQELNLSKYFINYGDKKIDLLKISKEKILHGQNKFGTIIKDFKNVKINKNKFLPDSLDVDLGFGFGNDNNKIQVPISMFYDEFLFVEHEVKDLIKKIKFLSPIRAIPDRAYLHYTDEANELLHDGSNAAHVFWAKKTDNVRFEKKEIQLITAVNKCIKILGLTQEIKPERIGNMLYQLKLNENSFKKNVSISDVGFGYSQILPVILIGLLNNSSNLILVEQPEIHLHPSSAANLADLFLSFIQDNKRFIIETHSQEFINRLRLRVIENPELKSKINIVFVEPNNKKGASIKQFKIDENGMFPEWPEGFIDESEKLANAILKARINKSIKRNE